jgi:hypothetical protein
MGKGESKSAGWMSGAACLIEFWTNRLGAAESTNDLE